MASKSTVTWPQLWRGYQGANIWTELVSSQKYADTGEMWSSPQNFDGKEIESISMVISAGTECGDISFSIQGSDTSDTINVAGFPDGTAIPNSSLTGITGIGGTAGWVTFTYTGTGPSPRGLNWIVVDPTASAGAYSFRPVYASDWATNTTHITRGSGREQIHDGVDWANGTSVGPCPMVIKFKDGTYNSNTLLTNPPISTEDVTFNNNHPSNFNQCSGALFRSPYDMTLESVYVKPGYYASYGFGELVLIDAATDTVLGRSATPASQNSPGAYWKLLSVGNVSLTAGDSYRLYVVNPRNSVDSYSIESVDMGSTDFAQLGLTLGDMNYCYADHPPSEGGVGTWTDSADTEVPIIMLKGSMDIAALSSGGGGGGRAGAFSR